MVQTCFRLMPAVVVVTMSLANTAWAQAPDPTTRENELVELIRKLNDRIDTLEERLDATKAAEPATFAPGSAVMEDRVHQLESSVQEIKNAAPPAMDAEAYAKMQQWFADPNTMRAYWKHGLRFDSRDGAFKLKIGGRIQNDWGFFTEESGLERRLGESIDDGTEFRRSRLYISGTIYDNVEFKAQYDFAGGDADFKDVYMGLKKVPVVGGIRVGHFKEPFSLEELTSSKYITFLERSLVNTFAPSRNVGMMLHNKILNDRVTWAAGFFRETDGFGSGSGSRDYNGTLRVTGLPYYEEGGRKLVHLGVSYTHKNFAGDTTRYRAKPEAHLAPRFVDTGNFSAEFADIVNAEAAWVNGPFSLQGEFVQSFVESRTMNDPTFWAASVQASYFLTGEHRPYKKSKGTFGNVKPKQNFREDGGTGAWELAARYSTIDLNDARIKGGLLRDVTLGLNWYLNPNLRVMWNYIYADAGSRGESNIFLWRFQIAF